MKGFEWNDDKNKWLKEHRNISFEEIVFFIENDGMLDSYGHPNKKKYPGQSVFVVQTDIYVYLVPYVEEEECYFLKTIIPNSEAKRKYLEGKNG